jgi:hypothetical protein
MPIPRDHVALDCGRNPENQQVGYAKLLGLARAADDKAALAVLEGVGAPPWTDPRGFGKVRRVQRALPGAHPG